MSEVVYTHGVFRVRDGEDEAFLTAYKAFVTHLTTLPGVRGGRLLQRLQDERTYYSFGEWESLEQVAAMRSEEVQGLLARMAECCEETTTGPCRVVEVG